MTSDFFLTTDTWRKAYPGAHAGVLSLREAANPPHSEALQIRKLEVEAKLRQRFAGMDRAALRADPILRAYADHYKRFDKTYHVQLQVESIIFKGKSIPSEAALVEAMFTAEVDSMLLTAGHDLDRLRGPLRLDAARGTESYVLLRGTTQTPKAGDMMISDADGILSSIVYGPDQRSQIGPGTTRAVFTVYAPAGIAVSSVEEHLWQIAKNVQLFAPEAGIDLLKVYPGD